ncbi:MAG: hypothetical protein ACJA2D_001629 [Pseudohongiellaceae bacterium]|jgi:hypothetical protein
MINLLQKMIRDHPSLLLTLVYLLVSAIGVIYSYFFYREFGINIVKFVDLSDFLLASIQEPISIAIFCGISLATLVMYLLDFWVRKKFPGYGKWMINRAAAKYTDPIAPILIVLYFVFTLVSDYAIGNANAIKAGDIDEYTVRFSELPPQTPESSLALIGSTSRFSYFYNLENKQALVVPQENIALMRKLSGSVQTKP